MSQKAWVFKNNYLVSCIERLLEFVVNKFNCQKQQQKDGEKRDTLEVQKWRDARKELTERERNKVFLAAAFGPQKSPLVFF